MSVSVGSTNSKNTNILPRSFTVEKYKDFPNTLIVKFIGDWNTEEFHDFFQDEKANGLFTPNVENVIVDLRLQGIRRGKTIELGRKVAPYFAHRNILVIFPPSKAHVIGTEIALEILSALFFKKVHSLKNIEEAEMILNSQNISHSKY